MELEDSREKGYLVVTFHLPLSISLDKVRRVAYRMVDGCVAS